jgi:hypothetical protein
MIGGADIPSGPNSLAEQIIGVADSLTDVLNDAVSHNLVVPPPIGNLVHDLRGWACRVREGMTARPTAIDAARLLAYLRSLPDHQLLALLADLPWARLDALLDAVDSAQLPSPAGAHHDRSHSA